MCKIHRIIRMLFLFGLMSVVSQSAVAQTPEFLPNPNSQVEQLVILDDGTILINGGFFREISGVTLSAPSTFARIDENGVFDSSFSPMVNGAINSIAKQSDGKIIVGGTFLSVGPVSGGFVRERIARLNADGSVDTNFNPGANAEVTNVFVQSDGKIVVAGSFTVVDGNPVGSLVRLNIDGSLDTSFDIGTTDFRPEVVQQQSDGKLIVGGAFMTVDDMPRRRVARLNVDGSLDTTFADPEVGRLDRTRSEVVRNIEIQNDGKIIIAGTIESVGDRTRSHIARLNSDGSLDANYVVAIRGNVRSTALQTDGKVVVGGFISSVDSVPRSLIARINENGTLDRSFDIEMSGSTVDALALQSDGKILVGGRFSRVDSLSRTHLVRLNSDGTLDARTEDMCFPISAPNGGTAVVCF